MDTLQTAGRGPLLAPTAALSLGTHAAAGSVVAHAHSGAVVQREGFRIGALHLMVRYQDASELADLPGICRLPNAPAWFLGMANLHGSLVPVFDIAARWGTAHAESGKTMLLVLGHGERRAGLVIDGLPVRLKPTAQDRLDDGAPPPALAGCVLATHRIDGTDWIDLDCDALLRRLEQELTD